ncbi:MAG: NADH-quinone oxidoreductase subunit C [Desulfovibrionales bacterium]|nr:MAG: NADH-quinone oxidoreductase subunit C [Desulfovibrionales bacterium]
MIPEMLHDLPALRLEACSPEVSGLTLAAYLGPEQLRPAVARLLEQAYFLEGVSVVEVSEGFLGVYHFDHFDTPGRIALRVMIAKDAPEIPTISDIYHGASWHERECRDFFGVVYLGNENMTPLLLAAEDAEFHPLRKSAKALKGLADLIPENDGGPQATDAVVFQPKPDNDPASDAPPDAPSDASEVSNSAERHHAADTPSA